MASPTTALVKYELPSAPIEKIERLREVYGDLASRVNLVTPLQSPDFIPASHKVSLRVVVLSADVNGGDVYKDDHFCEKDERAPTKVGLLKILQAAGGDVVAEKCRRVDDRKDPRYVEFTSTIRIPMLDGTVKEFAKTRRVDHRAGADETKGWSEKRLAQARKFTLELAETKALNRAIREGLALKQKYTEAELARPFVVPALVYVADMTDPEVRKMVAAKGLGVVDSLYGPDRQMPISGTGSDVTPHRELTSGEPGAPAPTLDPQVDAWIDSLGGPEPESEPVAPQMFVCGCPCGDQRQVSSQLAAFTTERVKCVRCRQCYPWGKEFAALRHADLPDMEMPGLAGLSGSRAVAANAKWLAEHKGGGA